MNRFLLSVFFSFVLFSNANAQKYNFRHYTAKNGLGSSNINNIYQDKKGYIWFSTQGGGVSRFNGKEFTTFTKEDGLISNDVTFVTEDNAGNIWIGTAEGASKYDGSRFISFSEKEGLSGHVIYWIYSDPDGNIWFATDGDGIKVLRQNKFNSFTKENGLSSNVAYSINHDKSGNLWFGLGNDILKYDGKNFKRFSNEFPLAKGKSWFSTTTDSRNNLWFTSTSGNVIKINELGNGESIALPTEVSHDFIGGIAEDKHGCLWIACDHGLLKYLNGSFSLFTEKEGLSVNAVQAVMVDYEGNLWIGTLGGGVNLFNTQAFVIYTSKDGLESANVTCVNSFQHTLFAGTSRGLFYLNKDSPLGPEKFSFVKELGTLNISSINSGNENDLWITAQEGIFVVSRRQNHFFLKHKYEKINNERIVSPLKLLIDHNEDCWVATYGSGLVQIKYGKEKLYNPENGFPSLNLLTVFEDQQKNIWIGTQDKGVIRYNGSTFEELPGFPDHFVWTITEDGKGNLYFGTAEKGLCILQHSAKGNKIKRFTTANGLCSNNISALQWDIHKNCLWLASESGINQIYFRPDGEIESIKLFREQEGFNPDGLNQNAIFSDDNGFLWTGTVNGLWRFNPQDYHISNIPPRLHLTGVSIAHQKVDWQTLADSINPITNLPVDLKLSYKQNHLIFSIQALTTEDVMYSYMLEGLDKEWQPFTKNNEIDYQNITPGKSYTFRAKAVNRLQSNQSSDIVSFSFAIAPPFWKTWGFRIGLTLFIVGLIILFIKAREKTLRQRNIKLEKTVSERTIEVVKEKERSDSLLLNILPSQIADELKQRGTASPRSYDMVTVMFTDFKNFTLLSEQLTAESLVQEIDSCYREFDKIISKHGVEKIKTIGDSYMCAGGLPVANSTNAIDTIRAALDIRDFMLREKQKRMVEGRNYFEIRIGLHTGPVVAGIVGIKKFAYDIWGDTVNIASRMEQNDVPGKINISGTTYELVKENFSCTHRGKIEAKNKGLIDMYFVDAEIKYSVGDLGDFKKKIESV